MKKTIKLTLLLFILSFGLIQVSASAISEVHSTSKFIIQYGPDGGLLFSIHAEVMSVLEYKTRGVYADFTHSDASISSTDQYSISNCNTSFAIRNYTNFGNSNVNLPYNSTYIIPVGMTIVGKNSGNNWTTYIMSPNTVNIKNEGYVQPAPNKCFGGGTVTDSWSFTYIY